jgi:phosphatidylglycerophosphatase A
MRTTTLKLWVAQGFGAGRAPFAPGTFGSLVGLVWFALLVAPGNLWLFLGGTLAGLALSVWLGGEGEKILKQTDPPSVVLDEITALPLCFAGWIVSAYLASGALPEPAWFFRGRAGLYTAGLFVAFRILDIAKPWPIRPSQRLPGGWGVTMDDALAGLFVALLSWPLVRCV